MYGLVYVVLIVVGVMVEATLAPVPLGLVLVILATASGEQDLKAKLFSSTSGDPLPDAPSVSGAGRETPDVSKLSFLLAAFLLGVMADILLLRPVGLTGLVYVGVVVLLRLYSRKFEIGRLAYLLPFTAVVVGLYSRFLYLEWRRQVVIALAVVVAVRWITQFIKGWTFYKRIDLL